MTKTYKYDKGYLQRVLNGDFFMHAWSSQEVKESEGKKTVKPAQIF